MKIYIAREEIWPVYRLYEQGKQPDDALPVEVSAGMNEWLITAQELADDHRSKLGKLYEEAEEGVSP